MFHDKDGSYERDSKRNYAIGFLVIVGTIAAAVAIFSSGTKQEAVVKHSLVQFDDLPGSAVILGGDS